MKQSNWFDTASVLLEIKQKLTARSPSVLFDQTWLDQAKTDGKLTSGGAALEYWFEIPHA